MASQKQLKYAKDLIKSNRGDPEGYLLDERIPGPLISTLLDSLKGGNVPDRTEWNNKVNVYLKKAEVVGPEAFAQELLLIRDLRFRTIIEKMLNKSPDYFFTIPASSTGKYHPTYALGEGGLLRHTKAGVKVAISLFENPGLTDFTPREKDIIIGALILHDTCKNGLAGGPYTVTEHPLLVQELFEDSFLDDCRDLESATELMFESIASHMGPWTKDYKTGKEVLPKPETVLEKTVHLCDYLASRRFLEVSF